MREVAVDRNECCAFASSGENVQRKHEVVGGMQSGISAVHLTIGRRRRTMMMTSFLHSMKFRPSMLQHVSILLFQISQQL